MDFLRSFVADTPSPLVEEVVSQSLDSQEGVSARIRHLWKILAGTGYSGQRPFFSA